MTSAPSTCCTRPPGPRPNAATPCSRRPSRRCAGSASAPGGSGRSPPPPSSCSTTNTAAPHDQRASRAVTGNGSQAQGSFAQGSGQLDPGDQVGGEGRDQDVREAVDQVVLNGTSKVGLNVLRQSMAIALAPYGITVGTVAPGFVPTEMAREVLDGPGTSASPSLASSARTVSGPSPSTTNVARIPSAGGAWKVTVSRSCCSAWAGTARSATVASVTVAPATSSITSRAGRRDCTATVTSRCPPASSRTEVVSAGAGR